MNGLKKAVLITAALCLICGACSVAWKTAKTYTRAVKLNWGIELPHTGGKELFAYSEPGFHGDGIRYHVIAYAAGNDTGRMQKAVSQLEKLFDNSSEPTDEQIVRVEQMLGQIEVEGDVIPDWKECSLICMRQEDGSELFMFYLNGTVYIAEAFL